MEFCERCFTGEVFGLLQLHTEDGHLVAEWWTCCECADRDAPIHAERGVLVSVVGMFESSW